MIRRLLNLPITVASKAARAFQDRQDARTKEKYGTVHDPGTLQMRAGVDTTIPKEDPKEDSLYAMDVVTIKALLGQKTPLAFVDIRPESAWSQGSLEGAMGMPEDTVGIRVSELPTDRMVVVVCGDGKASARVVRFFRERGMEDTWFLAGGLNAWVQAANSLVPLEVS